MSDNIKYNYLVDRVRNFMLNDLNGAHVYEYMFDDMDSFDDCQKLSELQNIWSSFTMDFGFYALRNCNLKQLEAADKSFPGGIIVGSGDPTPQEESYNDLIAHCHNILRTWIAAQKALISRAVGKN